MEAYYLGLLFNYALVSLLCLTTAVFTFLSDSNIWAIPWSVSVDSSLLPLGPFLVPFHVSPVRCVLWSTPLHWAASLEGESVSAEGLPGGFSSVTQQLEVRRTLIRPLVT